MTPDEMRALDARAARAITRAASPLLPWLAALYVTLGAPALAWYTGAPRSSVVAAGVLGAAIALAGLVHWRQSQRVARRHDGQ